MDVNIWSRHADPPRRWNPFARRPNRHRTLSKRPPLTKPTFRENTEEFTKNTTLHALKFVGDPGISYFERIFFLVAFVSALSVALNFTMNIYEKWSSTPVIIANNAKNTYITEIPFPAVTICNMNQAMKSRVTGVERNRSQDAILKIMCNRREDIINTSISITWDDFDNFISEKTQSCSEMLLNCRFAMSDFNCTDLFQVIPTDEGSCCTYNAVDPVFMYKHYRPNLMNGAFKPKDHIAVDWTPERGYPAPLPTQFYPKYAVATGYTMGLTVAINADIDEYYCSSGNGAGLKIILHSPIETPDVQDIGFTVAAGTETRVVVTPQISDASGTIRDMAKGARQCVFNNEINLTYFKTYSRRNCEMECEARRLADECGCISSFMPRIVDHIQVCGPRHAACFDRVNIKAQRSTERTSNCSSLCLPSCFELTYDVATFAIPIMGGNFQTSRRFLQNMSRTFVEKNVAMAHFYYVENAFRSRTKEQFVGFTEFLSSTGGLMSLFIGFGIISIVEFFYYATIRPFCASYRYKQSLATTLQKDQEFILPKPTRMVLGSDNKIVQHPAVHYSPYRSKFRRTHGFGRPSYPNSSIGYMP